MRSLVLTKFTTPQEGIKLVENNITVYLNDREMGKGTLYITESGCSWINSTTQQGFFLHERHMVICGITSDVHVYPKRGLYIFIDAKVYPPGTVVTEPEEYMSDSNPLSMIRYNPDNSDRLDVMLKTLRECLAACEEKAREPQDCFFDAEEDIYEDAEENDFEHYEDSIGDASCIVASDELTENQNESKSEDEMDVEAGQFEDAEEDP